MRKIIVVIAIFWTLYQLTGCVAVMNLNNFDDAKIGSSDTIQAKLGVTLANYWKPKIDSSSGEYKVQLDQKALYPLIFIKIHQSFNEQIEYGGEVSTTIGSLGIKLFGKFGLIQNGKFCDIAVIPSIGGGFTSDTLIGLVSIGEPYNIFFLTSLSLPITLKLFKNFQVTVSPQVFYVYNHVRFKEYDLVNPSLSMTSRAFSISTDIGHFRAAFTLVDLHKGQWLPLFGIQYAER